MTTHSLHDRLGALSNAPGVYLFRDAAGAPLYVGKAKRLRPRVRSYFRAGSEHGVRTLELVRRIADVETFVVGNEVEALLLESILVKEHAPPFNVRLKDDKAYPYIRITTHTPPEVRIVRRVYDDGARYFGPYTDVRRMRQALDTVRRIYTVDAEFFEHRHSAENHEALARDLASLLSGRSVDVRRRIEQAMEEAADALAFERAAHLRDVLRALLSLERQTQAVQLQAGDYDAVAVSHDGPHAAAVRLEVRGGRLVHTESRVLENAADRGQGALLKAAIRGFYLERSAVSPRGSARRILLPVGFKGREEFEAALATTAGHPVRFHVPKRGGRRRVVDLATGNARHRLEEEILVRHEAIERANGALFALQEALGLDRLPRRLVCFDIAHTQGTDVVASAVTFVNGEPHKAGYRRFRIRGDWGNDDFRSMNEVVGRHFAQLRERGEAPPDLVVVDGGTVQLAFAVRSLSENGLPDVEACALAKREEEIYRPGLSAPIRLSRRDPGLKLLQRARDEAHRFANAYTRKLRTRRITSTMLTDIPGIGRARAERLLRHFGSVTGVVQADRAEIAKVAGISANHAEAVLRSLRPDGGAGEDLPQP
jgi:excinuclease ABC subunit C